MAYLLQSLSYIANIYKFLWIRGAHEIHENLNHMEIINHIQYSRSFLLTVREEDGNQGVKIVCNLTIHLIIG